MDALKRWGPLNNETTPAISYEILPQIIDDMITDARENADRESESEFRVSIVGATAGHPWSRRFSVRTSPQQAANVVLGTLNRIENIESFSFRLINGNNFQGADYSGSDLFIALVNPNAAMTVQEQARRYLGELAGDLGDSMINVLARVALLSRPVTQIDENTDLRRISRNLGIAFFTDIFQKYADNPQRPFSPQEEKIQSSLIYILGGPRSRSTPEKLLAGLGVNAFAESKLFEKKETKYEKLKRAKDVINEVLFSVLQGRDPELEHDVRRGISLIQVGLEAHMDKGGRPGIDNFSSRIEYLEGYIQRLSLENGQSHERRFWLAVMIGTLAHYWGFSARDWGVHQDRIKQQLAAVSDILNDEKDMSPLEKAVIKALQYNPNILVDLVAGYRISREDAAMAVDVKVKLVIAVRLAFRSVGQIDPNKSLEELGARSWDTEAIIEELNTWLKEWHEKELSADEMATMKTAKVSTIINIIEGKVNAAMKVELAKTQPSAGLKALIRLEGNFDAVHKLEFRAFGFGSYIDYWYNKKKTASILIEGPLAEGRIRNIFNKLMAAGLPEKRTPDVLLRIVHKVAEDVIKLDNTIESRVLNIVADELHIDIQQVDLDTKLEDFIGKLHNPDLEMTEIIMALEREFDLLPMAEVDEGNVESLETVQDLVDYVKAEQAGKTPAIKAKIPGKVLTAFLQSNNTKKANQLKGMDLEEVVLLQGVLLSRIVKKGEGLKLATSALLEKLAVQKLPQRNAILTQIQPAQLQSWLQYMEGQGILDRYSQIKGEIEAQLQNAAMSPGGIDLNTSNGMQWKDSKADGHGVEVNINQAMIARIRREGLDSLSPDIFKITAIASIWPLAGLQAPVN